MFNKRKIETFCILLSFLLIILFSFLLILAVADAVLNWDILPKHIEKIMILFTASTGIVIGACFLLSLMINMSLISSSIEKIADTIKPEDKKQNE